MRNPEEYSFNLADNTGTEEATSRRSMNKNYRVGKIKFFAKQTVGERGTSAAAVMLRIVEWCGERWASYHLWLSVDDRYTVSQDDVGRWAEIGFYIKGSFREKRGLITTDLKMRHLTMLEGDDEQEIVIGGDDFIKEDDVLSVPTAVITVAKDIYEGTLYEPKRIDEELN